MVTKIARLPRLVDRQAGIWRFEVLYSVFSTPELAAIELLDGLAVRDLDASTAKVTKVYSQKSKAWALQIDAAKKRAFV